MYRFFTFAGLLLCGVCLCSAEEADLTWLRQTVESHCLACHGNGDEIEGDVNLKQAMTPGGFAEDPELLQAVIDVLDFGQMPPEDAPQLPDDDQARLLTNLQHMKAQASQSHSAVGHSPIRRMNRFQYNNAVQDLFDLKCIVFTLPERIVRDHSNYFQPKSGAMPEKVIVGNRPLGKSQLIEPRLAGVAAFPQDLRAEHGYDNQADHLSLSPLLMEAFLNLGSSITQSPDFTVRNVGIWREFFAAPAADADLRAVTTERLEPFLRKAFRGATDLSTKQRYVDYVMRRLDEGAEYSDAMKDVSAAVLASPRFLYLYSTADGEQMRPLSDLELATRLSFFLWGSLPDEELLDIAIAERLQQEEVLDQQIQRMLHDEKVKRFCDSFPAQWLQLDRLISSVPNPQRFRDFYFSKYRESMHTMLEPLLLFESVLIENRPIVELIDPEYSYRSVRLQRVYDEPVPDGLKSGGGGVTRITFVRVPLSDRRYGGVITNAAVMTMTSGPDRTQPITRGAWLATSIFNDPPKPPPADVPPLDEKPSGEDASLTLRERLDLHRQRADCRGCHEQIDPLGFALENYDPVGAWRNQDDGGRDIDPGGVLFRKHAFADVIEFKDAILAEKERFVHGFTGHLLSFALARPLQLSDRSSVERIVQASEKEGYLLGGLVRQVVLSDAFRMRGKSE